MNFLALSVEIINYSSIKISKKDRSRSPLSQFKYWFTFLFDGLGNKIHSPHVHTKLSKPSSEKYGGSLLKPCTFTVKSATDHTLHCGRHNENANWSNFNDFIGSFVRWCFRILLNYIDRKTQNLTTIRIILFLICFLVCFYLPLYMTLDHPRSLSELNFLE